MKTFPNNGKPSVVQASDGPIRLHHFIPPTNVIPRFPQPFAPRLSILPLRSPLDMPPSPPADQERSQNNFGFLRLFLATLVILAHAPESLDGNRSREILTRLFGTLSFGEVAVDAFFILSGYLITASFQRSASTKDYLLKRILRIYPGYLVAFVFSLLVVGYFAGGNLHSLMAPRAALEQIVRMALLHWPTLPGAFAGLPYDILNVSMWTIHYEFNCYLLVAILSAIGLLQRRMIFLAMSAVFVAIGLTHFLPQISLPLEKLTGTFSDNTRLFAAFSCGACFHLFRDRITYDWKKALLAALLCFGALFSPHLAEPAVVILGGYLMFWFAFNVKNEALARIGVKTDVSYGLYLYAWPIQNLIVLNYRTISPWLLFLITTILAAICGFLSWTFIEKPMLKLKPR